MEIIYGQIPGSGSGDGSGAGYGYDSGDGYGYGYGYGDGYGDGSGDSYGSGAGYGYDSGDGYGYGYGYGDGSGDGSSAGSGAGYGDDSGYGSGDSYGEYWKAAITVFATKWQKVQRDRLDEVRSQGALLGYWLSDKDGRACNGGTNNPVTPGVIEKSRGPLCLCKDGTLHATLTPLKWKGGRWWIVALHGEVVGDNEKMGALEREIIGECL